MMRYTKSEMYGHEDKKLPESLDLFSMFVCFILFLNFIFSLLLLLLLLLYACLFFNNREKERLCILMGLEVGTI